MTPFNFEFIGLPGAGKTTIMNNIVEPNNEIYDMYTACKVALCRQYIPNQICPVSTTIPTSIFNFITDNCLYEKRSCTNSDFIQNVNSHIDRYTCDEDRIKIIKKWMRRLVVYRDIIDDGFEADRAVVWDEGFLQRALSVFCPPSPKYNISVASVQEYVTTIPIPDCVFLFDIPVWRSKKRMRNKPDGMPAAYRSLDEKALTSRLKRMYHCITLITEQLREKNVRIIIVDADESVRDTYRQVSTNIKNIVP